MEKQNLMKDCLLKAIDLLLKSTFSFAGTFLSGIKAFPSTYDVSPVLENFKDKKLNFHRNMGKAKKNCNRRFKNI